jgi:Xaa-Pro aminopeptidase
VAVLGGDRRMVEHMRQARAAGATVQHYGAAPGAEEAAGAPEVPSLAEAVRGARLISCPVPGLEHILFLRSDDPTVPGPGMVFHIPPALRVPGEFGLGVSEAMLVTAEGAEILTVFPRDLYVP